MVRDCTHKISHKCEYSLELVKGEVVTHSCSSLTPSKVLLLSSSQVPRQCSFQTTTGLTSSLECLSADQTISSFRFLLQMNLSKTINYHIKKKSGKCFTQNLFFGFKTAQNHYLRHLKIAKAKVFRTIVALHFLKRRVFSWLHLFFGVTKIKLF